MHIDEDTEQERDLPSYPGVLDIFAEPESFGEGFAALVEERVVAQAYSLWEPSVENDETRKLFVKGVSREGREEVSEIMVTSGLVTCHPRWPRW